MLVKALRKSNHGTHQELETQCFKMDFHSGKIFAAQESKAEMPRICARIFYDGTPFQVTYELQNTAETERNAILEDARGLRPEDLGYQRAACSRSRHGTATWAMYRPVVIWVLSSKPSVGLNSVMSLIHTTLSFVIANAALQEDSTSEPSGGGGSLRDEQLA